MIMCEGTLVKALVTNIQHFSLHDGPGIRTTVFMKGCPLSCAWCHNPECIKGIPQLQYFSNKCISCGACVEACINRVHRITKKGHELAFEHCQLCGKCVQECNQGALSVAGKWYQLQEIESEVLRDRNFYRNSLEGGVTVSGGEPLKQWKACAYLLKDLKREEIHTALDTCGCVPWTHMEAAAEYADLILYDIKAIDTALHRRLTGRGNERILDNLVRLGNSGARIWIRMPLVAGVNDTLELMEHTAYFLEGVRGIEKIELLPYHSYGVSKYDAIGLEYAGQDFEAPSEKTLTKLIELFSAHKLSVCKGESL